MDIRLWELTRLGTLGEEAARPHFRLSPSAITAHSAQTARHSHTGSVKAIGSVCTCSPRPAPARTRASPPRVPSRSDENQRTDADDYGLLRARQARYAFKERYWTHAAPDRPRSDSGVPPLRRNGCIERETISLPKGAKRRVYTHSQGTRSEHYTRRPRRAPCRSSGFTPHHHPSLEEPEMADSVRLLLLAQRRVPPTDHALCGAVHTAPVLPYQKPFLAPRIAKGEEQANFRQNSASVSGSHC